MHIGVALSWQSPHLTADAAAALFISIFYSKKSSYFCILLQGLWRGLLKFKLCVGLFLRNSLVLEVGSSLWDKAHGGRWAVKAGLDLRRGDGDETGQHRQPLEVAPFSQERAR